MVLFRVAQALRFPLLFAIFLKLEHQTTVHGFVEEQRLENRYIDTLRNLGCDFKFQSFTFGQHVSIDASHGSVVNLQGQDNQRSHHDAMAAMTMRWGEHILLYVPIQDSSLHAEIERVAT